MSKSKINVIVVDDHDLIREGLNRIISFEDDLIMTGQYSNGEDLINNITNIYNFTYYTKKVTYHKSFFTT